MISMKDVLAGCLADEPEAWGRLWAIIGPSLRRSALRRLLEGIGDGWLIDDAEQDFFLFLREDACRRLRAFRGEDEPAFRVYIGAVARNFLLSYRASRRRAAGREARALPVAARAEAGGPSEPQLLAILGEFVATLSADQACQLQTMLGPDRGPEVGARTLRRWRQDLTTIYRDRVLRA